MFKFRLQAALKLKENIEDTKKRELGIAAQKKESLTVQKQQLEKEKGNCLYSFNNNESINVHQLQSVQRYRDLLDQEIEKTKKLEIIAEQEVSYKRDELAEAVKERKILENLKERQTEIYKQELSKKEQGILDELVGFRYTKQRIEVS